MAAAFMLDRSEFALTVAQLSHYEASTLTRVYADDEQTVLGEFYLERRVPVDLQDVPPVLKQAFIAVEDARYYQHAGLDPIRMVGAFLDNLREGRIVGGGSTITQQLARGLFLTLEQTYSRKVREALLALLIERHYTKDQILELYFNQIYLGGNAYGVQAAAQFYFGKSVTELNLEESAMLAALPKAPHTYSPQRNPAAALQRRNLVLGIMVEQGIITDDEGSQARSKPVTLWRGERISNIHSPYAYVVELVRQQMEEKYGTQKTHTGGLKIYTTLSAASQQEALRAVRRGLHSYDRRHGWRGKLENILERGERLETFYHPEWDATFAVDDYIAGLVMEVTDREAVVRIREYTAHIKPSDSHWGRPLKNLVRRGDLTCFRIEGIDEESRRMELTLLQVPAIQGALVALDVQTGEIKSLVGGYDFNTSRFNHATQAFRQTGSAFKPFIYAAAIEYGLTPDSLVLDTPFEAGPYQPENYDRTFMGVIPIRTAVALSRNIPAVRTLQEIGVQRAARLVQRIGLANPMAPYLSSALGATEEPLLAMVKGYSTFASLGRRVEPHLVRRVVDRDGVELERWRQPVSEEVVSPYVASTVVQLLLEVVNRGTASSVRAYSEFSGWDVGGKTGTVNDFTDAWFVGFTPMLCTGVWVGYDEKKTLGKSETGSVAALPIWIEYMRNTHKGKKPRRFRLVTSPPPMMAELQHQRQLERGDVGAGLGLPVVGDPPDMEVLRGLSLPIQDSLTRPGQRHGTNVPDAPPSPTAPSQSGPRRTRRTSP